MESKRKSLLASKSHADFLTNNKKFSVSLRTQRRKKAIQFKRQTDSGHLIHPESALQSPQTGLQEQKQSFNSFVDALRKSEFLKQVKYTENEFSDMYVRLRSNVEQSSDDLELILGDCLKRENVMERYLGSVQMNNLVQARLFPLGLMKSKEVLQVFLALLVKEESHFVKCELALFLVLIINQEDTEIAVKGFIEGNYAKIIVGEIQNMISQFPEKRENLVLFELYIETLTKLAEISENTRDELIQLGIVELAMRIAEEQEDEQFNLEFCSKLIDFFSSLLSGPIKYDDEKEFAQVKAALPYCVSLFIQVHQMSIEEPENLFGINLMQCITFLFQYDCSDEFFDLDQSGEFLKLYFHWVQNEISLFHYYQISKIAEASFKIKGSLVICLLDSLNALVETCSKQQMNLLQEKYGLFKFVNDSLVSTLTCNKNMYRSQHLLLLIQCSRSMFADQDVLVELALRNTTIVESIIGTFLLEQAIPLDPELALATAEFMFNFMHHRNHFVMCRLVVIQFTEALVKLLIYCSSHSLQGAQYCMMVLSEMSNYFYDINCMDGQEYLNEIESRITLYNWKGSNLKGILQKLEMGGNEQVAELAREVLDMFFVEDDEGEDYEFDMEEVGQFKI